MRWPNTTPISALPVELLAHIFSLTTHSSSDIEDDDRQCNIPFNEHSVTAPLALSSVSRRWRNVALSMSRLWTSICLTTDDVLSYVDGSDGQHRTVLDTPHILSYLSRSRLSPLDILIDARDPDWEFAFEETSSHLLDHSNTSYKPRFHSQHISTAFDLLLPHVSRWRSLTILTDTWYPMHTALNRLDAIAVVGAPLLESLTLMRCNEYVGYLPEFTPQELKGPSLFSQLSSSNCDISNPTLPRLRSLRLKGVHMAWSALPSLLSDPLTSPKGGLHTLELAYHACDVRPSAAEFRAIMSRSQGLKSLVLNISGPNFPEPDHNAPTPTSQTHTAAVSLPHLEDLTIGYTSASDACAFLESLDAPHLRTLNVVDASNPLDPIEQDAGCLLRYLRSGVSNDEESESKSGAMAFDDILFIDSESDESTDHTADTLASETSSQPFPLLSSVSLQGVKAFPRPFISFFGALNNLKHLALTHSSPHALSALLASTKPTCPAPALTSLSVRGFHDLNEVVDIMAGLASFSRVGGSGLREVKIYLDVANPEQEGVQVVCFGKMAVTVVREVIVTSEEETDEYCGADPFAPGGEFNDPLFDAYHRTARVH